MTSCQTEPLGNDMDTQTDLILSAVEERAQFCPEKVIQLVGQFREAQIEEGLELYDMTVCGNYLRWLDSNGNACRQDISTIQHLISSRITPLTESDNRAQKIQTKWVKASKYNKIIEPIDLRGG